MVKDFGAKKKRFGGCYVESGQIPSKMKVNQWQIIILYTLNLYNVICHYISIKLKKIK